MHLKNEFTLLDFYVCHYNYHIYFLHIRFLFYYMEFLRYWPMLFCHILIIELALFMLASFSLFYCSNMQMQFVYNFLQQSYNLCDEISMCHI